MKSPSDGDETIELRSVALGNATAILVARQRMEEDLRAEAAALKIERRQLAEAQAMARVGSWRNDLLTQTVIWSDECCRILGGCAEELGTSFDTFYSRVHPEDRERVMAALETARATLSPYVCDHRLLLPDGTVKWVQGRCEFVCGSDGVPVSSIGTLQDITDRKATEAALQYREQLLRIASRIGRIGGWVLDLRPSTTLSWSDEVCAIHGTSPGHRPSLEAAIDFYAPEFREAIRRCIDECIRDATPFDVECQIINVTGERVWVRAVGEAQLDGDGTVSSLRGAFQDISERMNTLRALRESDQRFRMAAQATSDVVWDWNVIDDTCWWSDGLQTKFGYPLGQPTSQFWFDAIHPDDQEAIAESIRAALSSGHPWLAEYRFRKADGTYLLISDRALVSYDDAGAPCRMLGAMVDVTIQRTLEARLDEAERVSSVGKLAANMAHDFNNVLMGIQPFVEVIRRVTPDMARVQDAVTRISQSVKRGKAITDEILQLTRRVDPIAKPDHVRDWLLDYASRAGLAAPASLESPSAGHGECPDAVGRHAGISESDRHLPKMILIVDDEVTVAEGISMLLASEGLSTASIFEGSTAIAAIERHAPELVLLDIGLPDVSGVEVFKQIHERWPTLRVVLMTGHYSRSDLSAILALPHVRFLQKPFGVAELLTAIAA